MPDPISWELSGPYYAAALVWGYLVGSIPFGLILTRIAGLGDVRAIGSGNIGATNVLRTGRKDVAAATLILDGGKGYMAVLIAGFWGPDLSLIAALGAVLGHLFPVWLKFKGGKGVATALGVLIGLNFFVGLACCLTWLVLAALFRYSSLSSLGATASAPLYSWLIAGDLQLVEMTAVIALLVWFRHHQNIRRLLSGKESKIGQKS
ncbi:MAG: glycerol-3-phosphate 1-O-acyltransferase PlsY [Pseudomonadota bacterium]